ncbi:hypothetical protein E2C01_100519 [Portunus trituberculatus]|uniref:Uncharacterized protein n=1 Tax=Portunus trituberculatus TaxID=210409 RepID=A0A5B7KCF6_PORTR|nr:hypothetical protein [Portunus trituberculatus]
MSNFSGDGGCGGWLRVLRSSQTRRDARPTSPLTTSPPGSSSPARLSQPASQCAAGRQVVSLPLRAAPSRLLPRVRSQVTVTSPCIP